MARIHITGASGSGTTTLGAAVADRLGISHYDTDEFYWQKTKPPFTTAVPAAERLARLSATLLPINRWVLSGSALKWGEPLEPLFDLIVFVVLDPEVRLARLRQRERERYGQRVEPGGDLMEASNAFQVWAASYDTAGPEHRSRIAHEAWLAKRTVPVVRVDSSEPVSAIADAVIRAASLAKAG